MECSRNDAHEDSLRMRVFLEGSWLSKRLSLLPTRSQDMTDKPVLTGNFGAQDPVYGQVQLTGGVLLDVMDTQPFQRLRELCQLGTTKCAGSPATPICSPFQP